MDLHAASLARWVPSWATILLCYKKCYWYWIRLCFTLICILSCAHWKDRTAARRAVKHHQLIAIVTIILSLLSYTWTCLIFFLNNSFPHALCIFITFFFCPLISHQGVCKEEWWPAVICTRFDPNPPQSSMASPIPTHTHTHTPQPLHVFIRIHHPPLPPVPHTHVPSSLPETRNYFLQTLALTCALSLITAEPSRREQEGPAALLWCPFLLAVFSLSLFGSRTDFNVTLP